MKSLRFNSSGCSRTFKCGLVLHFGAFITGVCRLGIHACYQFDLMRLLRLPGSLSFYTLGGVFALMGTMAFFSTQHGEKPWFVWLQFIVDALFISMLLCAGV